MPPSRPFLRTVLVPETHHSNFSSAPDRDPLTFLKTFGILKLKFRSVYSTLTLVAHAYQKCIWIGLPTGWSSSRKQPKRGSSGISLLKKNYKHILHIRHVSASESSYFVDHEVALTHHLLLQNHQTVDSGSQDIHNSGFALRWDSLCYFLPSFNSHNTGP